jgi:two-component system OmpR family sensor kinase
MGRLFWKFFLSILLAQVAATIGIGGTLWLRDQARHRNTEPTLDVGPPAVIMLDAAAATLKHGGVDGLRELASTSRMRLYVLDATAMNCSDAASRPSCARKSGAISKTVRRPTPSRG